MAVNGLTELEPRPTHTTPQATGWGGTLPRLALSLGLVLLGFALLVFVLVATTLPRGLAIGMGSVGFILIATVLPSILRNFDRKQQEIAHLRQEVQSLRAMSDAATTEMDLPNLLQVAARGAVRTLSGEVGGMVLFDKASGKLLAEAFFGLEHTTVSNATRFQNLVRGGGGASDVWQIAVEAIETSAGNTGDVSVPPALGYLAVGKHRPSNPFQNEEISRLRSLVGTMTIAVGRSLAWKAAREGEIFREEFERERRMARAMTEALLPEIPPSIGQWEFSRGYRVQSSEVQVGGDVYDLFALDEERIGIVIADVSGKGLSAARQTAMVKYSLRSYAREHADPCDVLMRLNDALHDEPQVTGFVTLFYGVLQTDGQFVYASAGHEPPIFCRMDGIFELLLPTGMVLGALRDVEFEQATRTFHSGDALLLYTDGMSEARSPQGVFLEAEGIQRMLNECRGTHARDVAERLLATLHTYTDGKFADDTALLWVERTAS